MRRSDHHSEASGPASFSRPLRIDDVPDDGVDETIEADPDERAQVARDIGLPSIGTLAATFQVSRRPHGRLHVEGRVIARITQVCVVSLEPFENVIEQPIEMDFAPPAHAPGESGARARAPVSRRRRLEMPETPPVPPIDAGEDDPPDPIIDGRIDLGAVAVEFLTLGLDFYPRKPGVAFTETVVGETEVPKASAFAVLERLKDRT